MIYTKPVVLLLFISCFWFDACMFLYVATFFYREADASRHACHCNFPKKSKNLSILCYWVAFCAAVLHSHAIERKVASRSIYIKFIYRESPDSAVFGSPANRTIGKTALIGDWFSTKPTILDFWIFKVHFFGKLFAYLITFQPKKTRVLLDCTPFLIDTH